MTEFDPILSDDEIRERTRALVDPAEDDAQRAKFVEFVYQTQRGEAAEEAVTTLVELLAHDRLEALVEEYVVTSQTLSSVDYCRPEWTDMLASRLVELGFEPVDQEEGRWRVGWAGGETVTGGELCRVALMAVWLRKMSGLPGV